MTVTDLLRIHEIFVVSHALFLFIAIKDSKCLYLKNVPYTTTKEDLLRIFKAVDVRFPGGTEGPKKG